MMSVQPIAALLWQSLAQRLDEGGETGVPMGR